MLFVCATKVGCAVSQHKDRPSERIIRKCRILLTLRVLVFFQIIAEEIVTQYVRDAQQHLGIDTPAFENIVDVGALAVEMPCEPAHRALLAPEFRLDQFADMYHAVFQTKARATLSIYDRGSGMPTK